MVFAPAISQAVTVFDLRVSYYDTAANSVTKKDAIEASFRSFAEGLYEASNGMHKLGKVTIYTDGGFKDDTDILWAGGICWPNAHANGKGTPGLRIQHCDTFQQTNYLQQFLYSGLTLAHEWGHFAYGLLDEYKSDKRACDVNLPGSPCATDVAVQNSMMSSQWFAGTADNQFADLSWLNYSTNLNNNAPTNAQFRVYGASAWETLARPSENDPNLGFGTLRLYHADLINAAPLPGATPSIEINTAEGLAQAKSNLSFEWKTTETNTPRALAASPQVMYNIKQIVVDHSNNVSASILENVKNAANLLVKQAKVGDAIGVIAFANSANVLAPITKISDDASRTTLINAINSIQVSAQSSAMGESLKTALSSLKNFNVGSTGIPSVYLFADGSSTVGSAPLAQIDAYKRDSVTLFSFALNDNLALNTLLAQLATATRGEFYVAPNEPSLFEAVQNAEIAASCAVEVIIVAGNQNITKARDIPFYVDTTLDSVDIVLNYPNSVAVGNFSVIAPDGQAMALNSSNCDNTTKFNNCVVTINSPSEGLWTIKAQRPTSIPPFDLIYTVKGNPNDNNNSLFARVSLQNPSKSFVTVGSKVSLQTQVSRDFPVTDIAVSGKLYAPDGSQTSLDWHDDGILPDKLARDGLYSAEFKATDEGKYYALSFFNNQDNEGLFTSTSTTDDTSDNPTFTPVNIKLMRSAKVGINVTANTLGESNLANYERVMNWGEATVDPALLPAKNRQLMDIAPYKVRYYSQTNTYLGYNPTDGNFYIYNPDRFGNNIILLGSLTKYLALANKDGF